MGARPIKGFAHGQTSRRKLLLARGLNLNRHRPFQKLRILNPSESRISIFVQESLFLNQDRFTLVIIDEVSLVGQPLSKCQRLQPLNNVLLTKIAVGNARCIELDLTQGLRHIAACRFVYVLHKNILSIGRIHKFLLAIGVRQTIWKNFV